MRVASAVSTSGCQWDTTAATMQWICRWWTCNLSVWQQQNSLFHVLERWKKSTNKNSRFVWEFLELEIRLVTTRVSKKSALGSRGAAGGSEKLSHPLFLWDEILIVRKFKASQQSEAFGVTICFFLDGSVVYLSIYIYIYACLFIEFFKRNNAYNCHLSGP